MNEFMGVAHKNVLLRKSGWIKNNYLKTFVIVCFLILLITASYLTAEYRSLRKFKDEENKEAVEDSLVWVNYENEEFGFSFDRPKFLQENVSKDQGGYEIFIRFIETEFSAAKGIFVGVRKIGLNEEVARLKNELEGNFNVELISEKKIRVDGQDAVRLDYEPKDKEEFESRSLVIVESGEYSISISTVPEQVEKVVDSFNFL